LAFIVKAMPKEIKLEVDIEREAIALVKNEKTTWETESCFVTDKVSFEMRNVIRKCRKNYWGVFDKPQDPNTGRDKIWVHLTQEFVDNFCPTRDLDAKDINVKAKHTSAIGKTKIVRQITKNYLDYTYFGEDLDTLINDLGIDGTAVWQTEEVYNSELKKNYPKRTRVDLLNVYIDPTAESIQKAYRFTVRNLMFADEVKKMKGWINTDEVEGVYGLAQTDEPLNGTGIATSGSGSKFVDVYVMHGKGPKYLITGKKNDTEEIDIKIICSGLERKGNEKVHLIETYNGIKPYEEAWAKKVSNRWYGLGIAEKLMWYQIWANTVVNIRINRSYVSQLGIFKIKKGAGVTPQMIARLAANGAITVNSQDDIEQFQMNEASEASYKDEDVIQMRAQRVTGLHEAAIGEQLPASTPATNAVIQNNASQNIATLTKEGIGFFLQRWIKRQVWPILIKNLKVGEVLRMDLDPEDLRKYDEDEVNKKMALMLGQMNEQNVMVNPDDMILQKQGALDKLRSSGNERFITMDKVLDWLMYDCEVYISNETFDKGVLTNNLLTALTAAPEYKEQIMQAFFDIAGLNLKPAQPPMMPGQMPGQSQPQGQQNPQKVFTNANLPV